MEKVFTDVTYTDLDEFIFGHAKKPVKCKNGMIFGGGTVYPEINFTLPPMSVTEKTMSEVKKQYEEMTHGVCSKAHELEIPGILVEVELLPPCTFNPEWGKVVTEIVKGVMVDYEEKFGLKSLLRMTPVDIREGKTLTHMHHGDHWDTLIECFKKCAEGGADILSIESIGGKNLHDEAVMNCDLPKALFSLGAVGTHDMEILWDEIVKISNDYNIIPGGDTSCGYSNTSMVMANKNFIPRIFASVDRVMSSVRTTVAVERGAIGPDKDCGYEGVYTKAITGIPISMEGKSSACAHSSTIGNIACAVADCWSNESVSNIKLLGGMAPTVSMENLAYDCRLLNVASGKENGAAVSLRDMLSESDRHLDSQAYVLDPAVVLRISKEIVKGKTHLEQIKHAASATINELREAYDKGELKIGKREIGFLDIYQQQLSTLPTDTAELQEMVVKTTTKGKFDPAKYDM